MTRHFDHVVVGAGLSGIGAAKHLLDAFPDRSYAVLEARGAIGGTWDLFRYPGVRSDSDMYTLGYRFKPWTGKQAIADGASIRAYIEQTARENGIDRHVHFHHKVIAADWRSDEARWHLRIERTDTGEAVAITGSFLMSTSGYYRYDEGYTPDFAGREDFRGQVIHPQHWPQDLDYAGKRIVVIGSGATAVTLVPSLAEEAAHVTMLQRTPTHMISQPSTDPIAAALMKHFPSPLAARAVRARYLAMSIGFYEFCQRRPAQARALLRALIERQLPSDVSFGEHFNPPYDPWDQRLCLVASGDLFKAIRSRKADMVTDHVDGFTGTGIRLRSGRELDADIIVTATGLNLLPFGGVELFVDGAEVKLPETLAYKSMMLSDVPNFAFVIGYTNASWTLKADLVCEYVVRVLEHMHRTGQTVVMPRREPGVGEQPYLDFAAGYVLRGVDAFPKQGMRHPWRLKMNYLVDRKNLRSSSIADDILEFSTPVERAAS